MHPCLRKGNPQLWHPFHSFWSMTNSLIDCLLTTWRIFGTRKPTWENWQLRIQPCIVIRHWSIPWSSDTMVFDDAKCFCKCYKYFKWKEWLAWDSFSIRYMHFLTYGRKFVSACPSFIAFLRDHTDEQYANGCILSRICGVFFPASVTHCTCAFEQGGRNNTVDVFCLPVSE